MCMGAQRDGASWARSLGWALVCLAFLRCHGARAQDCDVSAQKCVFASGSGRPYEVTFQLGKQYAGPPLKIVTFGDSVVWGDGDNRKQKIVTSSGRVSPTASIVPSRCIPTPILALG